VKTVTFGWREGSLTHTQHQSVTAGLWNVTTVKRS